MNNRLANGARSSERNALFAGRFQVEGEAGVGGMSVVYRALDLSTGETVALKVLRETGSAASRRFNAEAMALEKLRSSAIVRYIDHGITDDDQFYLVLEWIDGESLSARLHRGRLDIADTLKLARRVADGLAAAHALGILHRDIKPSNILLPNRDVGAAKIVDFGLARTMGDPIFEEGVSTVTATGRIVGTPGYMAPEQAHGISDLDERADLFSLGCLLYRCLADVEAFEGSRALTTLARLVLFEPSRVSEMRADVPPELDELVAALLAKKRAQRPTSAVAVREALDRITWDASESPPRSDAPKLRDSKAPQGTVFGRYILEGRLGAGGMGELFRATDTKLERPVALKLLRGSPDRATSARLVREGRAAAALSHPNIVTIYDVGEHEGIPFLASECIDGKDLRAYVRDPAVESERKMRWLQEVARALGAAHRAGVVHGDVKPDNVMIAEHGTVKLVDFGLATAVPGCVVGTPAYLAPEQIRGEPLDGRADQFAWAVMAYELMTQRLPWPGSDPVASMASVLEKEPDLEGLPPKLAPVVARALHKRRDERFPTMEALVAELEAASRPPAARQRLGWKGRALLLAAMLSAAGVGLGLGSRGPRPAAPTAAAPAHPTSVVALPLSSSCAPAAVAVHREGLNALRSANWKQATTLFEKAAQLDPACPETQLRLTVIPRKRWPRARQIEQLRRTLPMRDALSERDRLVLDAFTMLISPEVPSESEAVRLLDEAVRRFPEDAELRVLATLRRSAVPMLPAQLEDALTTIRHATEIDSGYADGWQLQATVLCRLGRHEEEIRALDRCLEAAPGAVDCMEDRSVDLRRVGRCSEATLQARQWVAWDGEQPWAYQELADALVGSGASREGIEEALQMRWKHLPPEAREFAELEDRARLAIWTGQFETALRTAEELEQRAAGARTVEPHLLAALDSVDALTELGRDAEAAAVAAKFLRRHAAWIRGDAVTHSEYTKPFLFAAALEHGQLSPAEWQQATDEWERASQSKIDPFKRWVVRWGTAVGGHIPATDALRSDPRADGGVIPMVDNEPALIGMLEAYEGHIYLLAGDMARAIPLLENASSTCMGLRHGAIRVRAHLWLGMAKEKAGDVPGACEAYRFVLEQWGGAKPSSVTAQKALQRSRSLHCSK
ncbi:serine/threonine protein kinase [Pendulispora brunnea]|uniref:Serine/threonine protein kinase n=1 Tax=Pendulispora brunnea TaxID=2905690 RepID=A0ABZ2K9P8_9BACT